MSSQIFACPQCGAPVPFKSSIAIFAVCASCRSMVVRRDVDVESLGTMAQLPPDLSPLQIGTGGTWGGRSFELIGRLRVAWEDGSWNEWYALFSDGRMGWIAEAQGIFMVTFAEECGNPPGNPAFCHAGETLVAAGRTWTIADVKQTSSIAGEGELPFAAVPGSQRTGVDLSTSDGHFASLEYVGAEQPQFFAGAYALFDELKFTNLRPVPGWSGEATAQPHAVALACPICGATINLRCAGQSVAAVCGSCGSVVDAANPTMRLVQAADERTRSLRPLLPIGARGKFSEIEYEVIGFVERGDKECAWSEYLLFNPWQGFRWLVTYGGHWTLVDRLFRTPTHSGTSVLIDGRSYTLFARAATEVRAVLGEFYWKVRRGEACVATDYIDPPSIVSAEAYPGLQEVTWSRGEYVAREEVASAFGVDNLPRASGVYLNQPSPVAESWPRVRKLSLAAVCALVALQAICWALVPSRAVYSGDFVFDRAAGSNVAVTPHFSIDRTGAVSVRGVAPVDNNWVGMDAALVNAKTEKTYAAELNMENYHGTEDGEAWSEGSPEASVTFPNVPTGEYFLSIDADADPGISKMPYQVRVETGHFYKSNFIVALLLLSGYPAWLWWRGRRFERERWEQSSIAP